MCLCPCIDTQNFSNIQPLLALLFTSCLHVSIEAMLTEFVDVREVSRDSLEGSDIMSRYHPEAMQVNNRVLPIGLQHYPSITRLTGEYVRLPITSTSGIGAVVRFEAKVLVCRAEKHVPANAEALVGSETGLRRSR